MSPRNRHVLLVIEAFVLAPLLVGVTLGALLLFGVSSRLVFFPGRAVMSILIALGSRVSNAVGVVATGITWWAFIVAARVAIRWRTLRAA